MIYRMGTIEVDPANFLLTENGQAVAVEPLVFDLIVCLIENRDRLLTRQELFDEIWAGRVVSDTSLSNHIKSARKVLGDDGSRQQVIKTVHGRGYRFIAEIEEVARQDTALSEAANDGQRPAPPARKSIYLRRAIYGALLLILLAAGSRLLFFTPDEAIESVAVLPLKNLSNDPAQAYFVEGMQDALITRLSATTKLRVISKTSTMRYASTDKSIPEIALELNVDALIEGSVLRDADQVRITAQLIRGTTDEQLWARSYDRDLLQVLPLINEISMAIANEIEVAVTQPESDAMTQREPVALEVHELVLKGRHDFERFRFDQSLRYYQQAAELDPEFAPAHAGVAGSYLLKGFLGWMPNNDYIPKARAAALRAIALDGNSAGGYSSIGFIQLYFDWDWESAGKNLLRALELSPNDARIRHAYADYLMVMGDLDGSLKQVEIGRLYDPLSPMAGGVLNFHRVLAGEYDAVIEEGRNIAMDDPDALAGLSNYRNALWLTGQYDAALALYKKTWGKETELLQAMESGYTQAGHSGAIHALAEALAARNPGAGDYLTLAQLYARAGDQRAALQWLEQAYEHRQPQILHIKAMPVFDELRDTPEFQALIRRIGFPDTGSGNLGVPKASDLSTR